MSDGLVHFKIDASGFSRQITEFAAIANMTLGRAFMYQGMLLCNELIRRTPPFSGKDLKRMVEAHQVSAAMKRGEDAATYKPPGMNDPELENMTALAIGKRRVEKDIRRVIYGLKGAQLSERQMKVTRGNNPNETDWGTLQRCEGKQAVRVFAGKSGEVYGADLSHWAPDATEAFLKAHHNAQRGKRGRVTMAGQRTRNIGRWKWLNVEVVKESLLAKYVHSAQGQVGEAKGGWAKAYMILGGRMSKRGWVGKHSEIAGDIQPPNPTPKNDPHFGIKITNKSAWAGSGDPDRIVAKSMEGRAKAIAGDIKTMLETTWAKGRKRRGLV